MEPNGSRIFDPVGFRSAGGDNGFAGFTVLDLTVRTDFYEANPLIGARCRGGKPMSDRAPAAPSATRRAAKARPVAGNGKSSPSEDLLQALQAMRSGDFSVRM